MSSKILIASGTAHYDHLPPDLQRPELTKVVESVAALFGGQLGYTRVLEEISTDPTSDDVVQKLDRWFGATDRDRSDWVVFYYTGHGELDGDSLVLLTRNSEDGLAPSTGVSAEKIGQILMSKGKGGEKRRIKNCLVILDTCHSGAAAFDIIGKLRKFFDEDDRGLFYVLAAALPREEAMAGALARALIASIHDESLGGAYQRLLYPEQLRAAINRRLRPHAFFYASLGSSDEEPEFFPNPRYVPNLPSGATVADIRRAAEVQDLQAFWGPTSRGVELEQQPGWYFTGRTRVLSELGEWLQTSSDFRTRVITGSPGSGKSAILSKLVTMSDPEYRQQMPAREKRRSKAVPPLTVDLAVHAKGKTLEDITSRFAARLGVEVDQSNMLTSLGASTRSFHVVIDALDEAREPTRIARELLEPLSSLSNVKLLVGTRPEYADKLGSSTVQIRVDQEEYLDKKDLAEYVTARLLRKGEKSAKTTYKGKTELAHRVGQAVAEKAFPNFLVARLVTENLLSSPAPMDNATVLTSDFPETVAKAFQNYLARFADDERKVRDLLTPLAWAEGLGLPWENLWAPLASALARHSYDDADIRWLLGHAGSFVVESLEGGRSVYRLYHQALADYLRQGRDPRDCERVVVEALLRLVPVTEDGRRDWQAAHPYTRAHLAEHAARCNMLGDLLRDPTYLLMADPRRLAAVLDAHENRDLAEIARVYKLAVHHIREKPVAEAASYLEMIARQSGAAEIADHVSRLPLARPWGVPWARWRARTPSRAVAKGSGEISVLETATWEDQRPVALVGRKNGSVEIWDVGTGAQLFKTHHEGVEEPWHMAMIDSPDGRLLVVSWYSGNLGVFNLATGARIVQPNEYREHGKVTALCVAELHGKPVCVTAQGRRLTLRELPTLKLITERPAATGGAIYCLTVVQHKGERLVISGNDSFNANPDISESLDDSKLRFWSLEDLAPVWRDGRADGGILEHIETGVYFGRMLLVTSEGGGGRPEIWDLLQRRCLFRGDSKNTKTFLRIVKGETLLMSEYCQSLTVHRLGQGDRDSSFTATLVQEDIPIQGTRVTRSFDLNSRPAFVTSMLDHLRVWDIQELLSLRFDDQQRDDHLAVTSLAASLSSGQELYAGSYGRIVALDATTGETRWRKATSENVRVQALALPNAGGSPKLIAGDIQGVIHVLDRSSPTTPVRSIDTHLELQALCTVQWAGQTYILATVGYGRCWSTRIWSLETGEQVPTDEVYRLFLGEEDKVMYGLAARAIDDGFRFAFASKYGKVMVADIGRAAAPKPLHGYKEWVIPNNEGEYVHTLATGRDSRELLLAAGTEYGHLVMWNFLTGAVKWNYLGAHLGEIHVLCFHNVDQSALLVSGGEDGAIRFWTARARDPFTIDVGEPIRALAWVSQEHLAVGTERGVLMLKFTKKQLSTMA